MLRAVLVGLLAVTAVGCGKKDDAPPAQAGAPAGAVRDVSGAVTVAGKPLAKGATVAADDVVETGADGNVTIELAHNKAIWTLGPNKHEKVSSSLAWTLAKNEGNAKPVDQDTSAAGRPAERSAADTSVTAAQDEAAPAPGGGVVAPMAPPTVAAAAPAAAAPQPPPPPPAVQPPAKVSRAAVIEQEKVASKKVEVPGEKYLKCLTSVNALHLVLHGQANGKTTAQVTGGVKLPPEVKACVDKVTASISLEPGAHADVDLTK